MPNVYFYAAEGDHRFLLDLAFSGKHPFRVFEPRSAPNTPLREYTSAEEVLDVWRHPARLHRVCLLADGSAENPTITRVELRGGHPAGSFDFRCEGWGLLHLDVGSMHNGRLAQSTLGVNSESRAHGWASTIPRLGSPDDWNWTTIRAATGWFGRQIRKAAVTKEGAHPVLPAAADLPR